MHQTINLTGYNNNNNNTQTTEVITRARINARLTTCPWYNAGNQLRVVSGEEVCLQRYFKTVNRLLGANTLWQTVPLRGSGDGE